MNDYFNLKKGKFLLLVLFAMLAGGVSPAWADELTVYDGTNTNNYVPIYGSYADAYQKCEFIIPAADLSDMSGKSISAMKFYSETGNISWSGTFQVFLKEVEATTFSAFTGTTDATIVYNQAGLSVDDNKEMTVTFSENYAYNGGNLLVGFYQTTPGNWKGTSFYGLGQGVNTAWQGYSSSSLDAISGSGKYFIPKTTFTYEANVEGPGLAVYDVASKLSSGYSYDFGLAVAGSEKTFTLKNPGTESITLNITATGGFGVSPASMTIDAKGEATLTVTMADATAEGVVTITPTATGVDAFTINVSGTVRDANKVYLDFADGAMPDGWTSVGIGSYASIWSVATGYISHSGGSNGYESAFTSPKLTFEADEQVYFETARYGSSTYYTPSIKVEYSIDGTTWTTIGSAFTDDVYGTWTPRSVTIPTASAKYIRFSGWYVHLRNIYGGELPLEPKMVVTQPASLNYGIIAEATAKTFTIANTGRTTLNGINVVSSNPLFTITNVPTTLAAGESQEVTITMATTSTGLLSADITVSATDMDDVQFTVSGVVLPEDMQKEEFTDGLPTGWTNASWTFNNGEATGKNAAYLTTPKLKFSDGDFIVIKAKRYDSDVTDYITVQGSSDGGSTWTAYSKKITGNDGLTYPDYATLVVSDIPTTVNKLRFVSYYVVVDEIAGLTYDDNDPKMGIYADADCTEATTTSVTKDFGFVSEAQTTYYYIKNDGTGTMTLSLGENPTGFTASLDKTSVTAGDKATLTITMTDSNAGYCSGSVVVTATDLGTFTVALTGVVVNEDKLNLDFATDNIPGIWTTNNWSKNANGYIETSGYSSTSLETTKLTAEAGEELVILARQTSTSSSYTFGVNYKQTDADSWSTLIAAANIGTNWVLLHATIEEAGEYLLQFKGAYSQIKHIYGLSEPNEPVMVIYDGEDVAGSTFDFGNVTNEEDVTHTFVVKNEGKASLTGLTATISALGGSVSEDYTVSVSSETVEAGGQTTIIVTQKKDNLGAHTATLTISANDLGDKVITLSGTTRDAAKLFVDFEGNAFPTGWTKNSWTVASTSGNLHARAGMTASSLITTPLTVAEGETLTFLAKRQYSSSAPTFQIRYTTNGGITWTEYADYASQVTSGTYTEITLTGIPAGNVVLDFYGRYVDIDNIYGFAPTTAPVMALYESSTAVATGSTKELGNMTSDITVNYTLYNTGNATMRSTLTGEGITVSPASVEIGAGENAQVTVTMPYAAPYGEKNGTLTISTEGWVADMTVNYTATAIDPTAVYLDFSDNVKPEGFYSNGWTFSRGYAENSSINNVAEMITSKLTVADEDDIITFDARAAYDDYGEGITVSYSADRKNWTEVLVLAQEDITNTYQTFQVEGLAAGDYYLKLAGKDVYVDNIIGWHYAMPVPGHDLYLVSTTLPTETVVPGADYTASVSVASLRADEVVAVELWIGGEKKAELTEQTILKNATETFELTGAAPMAEGKTVASVRVYNDDASVETEEVTFEVAHNRSLQIVSVEMPEVTTLDADENNQFVPNVKVTVKNTGSVALPADYYHVQLVKNNGSDAGTVYSTIYAESELDVDAETTLTFNEPVSAGEGGELEYWIAAVVARPVHHAEASDPITFNVNAAAPKFALYQDETPVGEGDNVDFGLVREARTFSYVIKNEGNQNLELVSIEVPTGFSATELTADNKIIEPGQDNEFNLDITLLAEQGKVSGTLVITYKVDAQTNKTFTLDLSGRSVAADTWIEDFESGTISADWSNPNGWTVYEQSNGNHIIRLTGWDFKTITTPRLAAQAGEELTFDVPSLGNGITYAYSTDGRNWSDEVTISSVGEQIFVAPAAGNYYLRFTARNAFLDNFVGFRLNPMAAMTLADTEDFSQEMTGVCPQVTLGRSFNAGWATLVLPFDVTAADMAKFGEGAKFYTLDNFDAESGVVSFKTVTTGTLVAGTPYLANLPAAIESGLVFENVAVTAEKNDTELSSGMAFRGNYDAGMSMSGKFGVSPAGKLQRGGDSSTMKAYRAYIELPAGVSEARIAVGSDEATGMRIVLGNEELPERIFNLNGQRVGNQVKGLYIVNGKKVVKK